MDAQNEQTPAGGPGLEKSQTIDSGLQLHSTPTSSWWRPLLDAVTTIIVIAGSSAMLVDVTVAIWRGLP